MNQIQTRKFLFLICSSFVSLGLGPFQVEVDVSKLDPIHQVEVAKDIVTPEIFKEASSKAEIAANTICKRQECQGNLCQRYLAKKIEIEAGTKSTERKLFQKTFRFSQLICTRDPSPEEKAKLEVAAALSVKDDTERKVKFVSKKPDCPTRGPLRELSSNSVIKRQKDKEAEANFRRIEALSEKIHSEMSEQHFNKILKWKTELSPSDFKNLLLFLDENLQQWQAELSELKKNDPNAVLMKDAPLKIEVSGKLESFKFRFFGDKKVDLLVPGIIGQGADTKKTSSLRIDPMNGVWTPIQTMTLSGSADQQKKDKAAIEREVAMSQIVKGTPHNLNITPTGFYREYQSGAAQPIERISVYSDWMPNGSLQSYIGKPISDHDRLKLIIDLFESQKAFYDKKILHHDMKSDNALVDKDGRLQAIDTGEADYVNQFGQYLRGAPNFRSPEKIAVAAVPTYLEKGGLAKVSDQLRKGEITLDQALAESDKVMKALDPTQTEQKENLEKAHQSISHALLGKSGEFSAALLAHEILHTRPGSKSTHPVIANQTIRPMSVDALVSTEDPGNISNVQMKLFGGRNPKLHEEKPISSTSENPAFYPEVDRLIWKMLALDPKDRASFDEAIKKLKKLEKKNFSR